MRAGPHLELLRPQPGPAVVARPAQNRVDVLVGNPPWLAFRYMTEAMQKAFREYSDERGLWHGAKVATHQDLSGLFLVRAVERYLRIGGRFAFIMPNAAVDRGQFKGLRSGSYKRPDFAESRDHRVRSRLGPPPDSAAFLPPRLGRTVRHAGGRAEAVTNGDHGLVGSGAGTERQMGSGQERLEQSPGKAQPRSDDPTSPWSERFRQGATIVPRFLFFVTRKAAGPLGMPAGKAGVHSLQRANDKKPWKDLPALEGVVETEFIRPVLLGESVLPFRIAEKFEAVLPRDREGLMDGQSDRLDAYEGLASLVASGGGDLGAHRSSDRLTLIDRLDYHSGLEQQFPIQPERIVYNASGMHLVASRLNDRRAVIEHKLYWATAASTAKAQYLCAILNSAIFTELVRPFMSYGKDERDFDKHIWQLPIPLYDTTNDLHSRLSARGAELEAAIGKLELVPGRHFAAVRRDIRGFIAESEAGQDVEALVEELLS